MDIFIKRKSLPASTPSQVSAVQAIPTQAPHYLSVYKSKLCSAAWHELKLSHFDFKLFGAKLIGDQLIVARYIESKGIEYGKIPTKKSESCF